MTGARVLIAMEDVTAREFARRALARSEHYARGLFEHSPVSLWVEDFCGVKRLIDEVRSRGITDLRVFTDVHAEFVPRCMSEIRVIDVNQHTLSLSARPTKPRSCAACATSSATICRRISASNSSTFGKASFSSKRGRQLCARRHRAVLFICSSRSCRAQELDWSLVQVALTDITARKKAEAYLEYLGTMMS